MFMLRFRVYILVFPPSIVLTASCAGAVTEEDVDESKHPNDDEQPVAQDIPPSQPVEIDENDIASEKKRSLEPESDPSSEDEYVDEKPRSKGKISTSTSKVSDTCNLWSSECSREIPIV